MSTEEHVNDDKPLTPQVAPLWRRFIADSIDLALVAFAFMVALIAGLTWGATPFVFACFIAGVCFCPPSPGRRALGLHLVHGDFTPCTRWEMLKHELLQLPAVGALLFKCEGFWKTSSSFDGEWRRTARDHRDGTFLVYCPELSGEVRERGVDYAAEERERARERARASVATPTPKAPPGQKSLFSDEDLADAEEQLPGLVAGGGKVHAASVDGDPLCGVKRSKGMTPTDREITCKRCGATGGTSKSKKGADAR